ncbi:MAG: hypothetical protein KDA05_04210 [Phycisphaerales bacterium]|nr:hypothetical protein [Phycisphaerales bacterium]MCB9841582.1 hypothetical protein [Phycisphaeraceae bacterium]
MARHPSTKPSTRKPRMRRDSLGRNRRVSATSQWSASVNAVRMRLNHLFAEESLAGVALELGVNSETLRRQLAGPGGVSLELVLATITMRNVSAEWLLRGTGRPTRR